MSTKTVDTREEIETALASVRARLDAIERYIRVAVHPGDDLTRFEEAKGVLKTLERCAQLALEKESNLLDPNMKADSLRLHMGEMTAQEVRTARAAIAWANNKAMGRC